MKLYFNAITTNVLPLEIIPNILSDFPIVKALSSPLSYHIISICPQSLEGKCHDVYIRWSL